MPPLNLSDDELAIVMDCAKPLRPAERNAFLVAVSIELGRERQLGPGIVSRVCRNLQRGFFDPPDLTGGESKCG
jgi:hypothetical protein